MSVPAPASSVPSPAQKQPSESPLLAPSSTALASPSPSPTEIPSVAPSPTVLPSLGPSPTFSSRRVATRIVISRLGIDLPIMLQTPKYGTYPLCDVAMYLPSLGQPGEGRATYIYAHARAGMFLPILTSSQVHDGQGMIGDIVDIYTADGFLFKYKIAHVHRHTLNLDEAFATKTEEVFLQTSEGPKGTVPKLQVIATFVSVTTTDWASSHPVPRPRRCG